MSYILTGGKFADYDDKIDALIEWMAELGARIDPARVSKYRQSFSSLLEVSSTKDEVKARVRFAEYVNCLYEVHELIEIHNGLCKFLPDDFLRSRVKTLASGPINYMHENSSSANKARNEAFELLLASRLAGSGLEPHLNHIADIACEAEGRPVFFECKRPQSEEAIERNAKRANSQLKTRYSQASTSRSRGVICIEITKVVNPDFDMLPYESSEDINGWLTNVIDVFSEQYARKIESFKHRKTIAIITRMSIMAAPKGEAERIVYCQQYGFNYFASSRQSDQITAKYIGERLRRAPDA